MSLVDLPVGKVATPYIHRKTIKYLHVFTHLKQLNLNENKKVCYGVVKIGFEIGTSVIKEDCWSFFSKCAFLHF